MEALPSYTGKSKYALFILPVFYGFLFYLFYSLSRSFFTTMPDPTYVYLINGTNLASGNFDVGHFDHPGTPVQWLVALVVFITHIFVDSNPINESVLVQPELYLRACATALILLLIFSVYASGRLILKHTGNIITALLFQLIPICAYGTAYYLIRPMPEALIIIYLSYYPAFLYVLCYTKNNFPDSSFANKNFFWFFCLASALLVTTKITCIPFMVIPLFFINGFSKKILYIIASFALATLIIFPV